MNTFLRFCSIISIVVASLKLAMMGHLTPGIVILIMICGLLVLIGNRTIYIIVAALAAVVLFIKINGNTSAEQTGLLGSVLVLAIALFGLYVMFRGLFPKRSK